MDLCELSQLLRSIDFGLGSCCSSHLLGLVQPLLIEASEPSFLPLWLVVLLNSAIWGLLGLLGGAIAVAVEYLARGTGAILSSLLSSIAAGIVIAVASLGVGAGLFVSLIAGVTAVVVVLVVSGVRGAGVRSAKRS